MKLGIPEERKPKLEGFFLWGSWAMPLIPILFGSARIGSAARKMMPNPKSGTVVPNLPVAIKEAGPASHDPPVSSQKFGGRGWSFFFLFLFFPATRRSVCCCCLFEHLWFKGETGIPTIPFLGGPLRSHSHVDHECEFECKRGNRKVQPCWGFLVLGELTNSPKMNRGLLGGHAS